MPEIFIIGDLLTIDEIADQFSFENLDDPPTGLVQIGFGESDSFWICLDYRHGGSQAEPAVVCYVPTYDSKVIVHLAKTFGEFEAALFSAETHDCYAIVSELDKSVIWEAIAEALQLENHPENHWGEQPAWRAGPLEENPGAKAGFYIQANAGLYGSWDFPEHSQCQWILHCDVHPRHRDAISQMLSTLPFEVILVHQVDWSLWGEGP
jgi:hypothetical protein